MAGPATGGKLQLKVSQDDLKKAASRMFKAAGVPQSFEFDRIEALPRRVWQATDTEGMTPEGLAELLTNALKRPGGKIKLWPRQARVLQELHDYQGAVALLAVGRGKTICSFLAPAVVDAKRPLLLVPAKLREKTKRDFAELSRHFYGKPPMVVSYEKLSREGGTELLHELNPDLIIGDEIHRLINKQAACTRRVRDWMKHHPDTALLAMSGTITKRSLHNFAHVLEWTLGKRRMPLPSSQRDLDDWARAVDVDEKGSFKGRMPPGALVTLFNQEERDLAQTDLLKATRHTVKRRLHETPGVIASEDNDDDVPASLNIEVRPVEGYGPRIEKLFEDMNNDILPNGDPVTDSTLGVRWGKCRELTSGFWYDWDPRPPDDWLLPRRAWKKLAAAVLDRHLQGLESEGVVAANLQRFGVKGLQKFGVGQDLAEECAQARVAWDKVKDTFKPNIVPRWESDRMVEEIAKWTKHHKGLIWISEVALGERLEKEGIVPYYGRMGLDGRGRFVEDAKRKQGSIALSVGSNSEGRNLQHEWDEALVVSCPPTGTVHEQMYGRLHRPGQQADEVWFEILIGCGVEYACWIQALKDAHYAVLDGRKKLTYCSKSVENMPWGSNALWPLHKKTQ